MSSGRSTKVCVVCREDCSSRPRTKDSRGNYYCTPCYEQRLEQVRQGKAPTLVPPVIDDAAPKLDDDIFALDPSLIAQEASPAGGASTSACPSCGMGVQPGGIICMNCGCNLQTGQSLRTKVRRDHSAAVSGATNLLLNPMSVGVAALLFFAVMSVIGLQSAEGAAAFFLAYFAFSMIVSIWAIVAGFMDSAVTGILTLCIPFYVLYTVYAINENSYLKWLYSVNLLCIPVYVILAAQLSDTSSMF